MNGIKTQKGISITFKGFPNQNQPFEIQKSPDFGLQVGQAIQYEWFKKQGTGCKFFDNRNEFHNRRLYANGLQSVSKYKGYMATNGDLSYLNLDWSIVPIIPKFCDLISNGMSNRDYAIKAFSIDPVSTENRISYRQKVKDEMDSQEFIQAAKEGAGIDLSTMSPDKLPQSDQELDLHMKLDYKPSIEISTELAVQSVLEENSFSAVVKSRYERDIVEIGIGAIKHRYSHTEGIKVEYVDPANLIWSYTEDPYFKDCFYWGEYKNVNISEVYKEYPNLSTEERERLQNIGSSWSSYYDINAGNSNDDAVDGKIGLLYFNYKTSREKIWKKKQSNQGGSKIIAKNNDFVYKGNGDVNFEKLTKIEEVWFEGVLVLGTNILLEWELCKNMVKSKSNLNKVMPNYVVCAPKVYKGYIDSIVSKMIPFADDIQMSWLKLQQIKQRVVPDGQYLDVDGLADISLGNGAAYTVDDALNMYFQTGTVLGRSSSVGGEFNNAKVPIQEIRHSSGSDKIQSLWESIKISLDMIASVTGINQAVDGSNPDKDALVGLQKMAAYSSNVATRHLINGSVQMMNDIASCISIRISDVLEYSETRDDLIRKIGRISVTNLEDIKDLYLYDFAINIELAPDEEERAKLEQDITFEIQSGGLGVEDKYAILNIKNIKLASNFLTIRKKKRAEEMSKRKNEEIQAQTQGNIQSAQAAAESKAQLIQMEGQSKAQIETARIEGEIRKMQMEVELKKQLMQIEFDYNMQLKGIEVDNKKKIEMDKEDRKDNRTKLQATQQSKMVEQRKQDSPAINFESEEDSLDGFDFSGFEPR
jgi:hypothetical protein